MKMGIILEQSCVDIIGPPKFVCMFFRCSMNKTCDITNVVLSGNMCIKLNI